VVKNPQTPMFSMEDTIKLDNQIVENQQINKDLQSEVTIEEETIHDLEFA
jgi:cell division protein FtsB